MEHRAQHHNIPPVYDERSRVLILGSFPSVKSREEAFFYAHPQNRFWRVLAAVLGESVPQNVEEKKALLLRHGVALWDVIASCEISGSSDASIKNVKVNCFTDILKTGDIRQIFCNGGTAYAHYVRYAQEVTGMEAVRLPSTSPANARSSIDELTGVWRAALAPYLEGIEERGAEV